MLGFGVCVALGFRRGELGIEKLLYGPARVFARVVLVLVFGMFLFFCFFLVVFLRGGFGGCSCRVGLSSMLVMVYIIRKRNGELLLFLSKKKIDDDRPGKCCFLSFFF